MNEDWSSSTLDDILSDVQRMTREREEAQAMEQNNATPLQWTMQDVDALLGLNDPLSDISDYSDYSGYTQDEEEITVFTPSEPEPSTELPTEPSAPEAVSAPEDAQSDAAEQEDAKEESSGGTKVMPAIKDPSSDAAGSEDGKTRPFAARLLHKKNKVPKEPPKPEVDGQIMLQGFDTEEEAPELDEEVAELELNARRAEQVKDFKLYDLAQKYDPDLPPKTDIFDPEPEPAAEESEAAPEEREYRRFGERMQIGRFLQERRRSAFFATCGLLIIEIALIVLSAITGRSSGNERAIFYAANLILTASATALSITTLSDGARDLIRLHPSCDSAALITITATIIHSVVALMLPGSEGIPGIFGAAAVLSLLLSKAGKLFEQIGILGNFKFCAFTAAEHLHEIRPFADKKDTFEIARPLDAGNPHLRYASKTKFPSDFLKNSDFRSAVDRLCKIIVPAAFGAALVAALFGWIRTKVGLSALTAFTGAICFAMPAGAAFTVSVPVVLLMQRLNRQGGMIVSPAAASANTGLTAVAMDATDLYDVDECSIDCYKEFYAIRFDDMFLYAAALVIGAHGPLESAFMEIVGNTDILPPAKNLVCEERLGISAYIRGQSVLLGNRNLLHAHSVEAPAKSVEVPYLQEGKRILYLAVGNKVTTMFVVNYIEKDSLAAPMQILHNNETDLVVYTADCNLTEEFLCEGFDMPQGSIHAMSSKAGEILRTRCAEESESAPALLMTGGKASSLLHTLADAAVIHNIQRVAAFVSIVACVIGWLATFVLMLIKGIGVVNWVGALLYTLLWIAVSTTLGVLQMRKAK